MRDIQKRIDAIQRKAEQVMRVRAQYEPFSVIRILSLLDDKADVIFYPHGLSGEKETSAIMPVIEAFETAEGRKVDVSMSLCYEWWHAYAMTSPLYSDEQKAHFKESDLRNNPEIAAIYNSECPKAFIEFLSTIPQSFRLRKE